MKKLLGFLVTIITTAFLVGADFRIKAEIEYECGDQLPTDKSQLEEYVADCEAKRLALQGQAKTLAQAISYLNTQINLTQAKIATTTKELEKLDIEINDLTGKIESIDYSLTDLTKLFVARVRETYIRQEKWSPALILQANSISEAIRRTEYEQRLRDRDREIMVTLEKSRLDYDNQKTEKETKQEEVERLKLKLDAEKNSLSSQKAAKDKLLQDTQNDEKKYASLLSQAQRQLASFHRFVTVQGGASLLGNETKCDDWGCYYNQRDSAWGNQFIGLSDSLMREYGCLVTSMSMIASHYGKGLKPGDIAANSSPFFSNTAYMNQGTWTASGVTMTRTRLGSSLSLIDEELAAGRPVVVGIYAGPDHFLVIKGKEGSDYIMHDPFPSGGSNLKFTSKYPLSAISVVDRVTVN